MHKEEIREQIKRLIVEELAPPGVEIRDLADDHILFGGGLDLDSLDAVEIAVILHRTFGLEVRDAELGRRIFRTIDTLSSWIYENQESP